MIAIVFSGGAYRDMEFYREFIRGARLVIAADCGGAAVLKLGLVPHVVIGDMDSIGPDIYEALKERGAEVIELPPEKDFTDTELAVRLAVERGAREIVIFGAIGSRIDHTLANVSLLLYARGKGVPARIVNEDQELRLMTPRVKNHIGGSVGDTLSFLSLAEETHGITTHDLKYPLTDGSLSLFSPLGVSNEVSGPDPWVEYEGGLLLLVTVRNP